MKTLLFVAASTLTLAIAACGPNTQADRRAALDCPARQGDLTRTGQTADGKTCTYRSSEGAEVSLQLVAVKGDAMATLHGIEEAIAPEADRSTGQAAEGAKIAAGDAKAAAAAANDASDTAKDAAAAARQAAEDAGRSTSPDNIGDKGGRHDERKGKVDVQIDGAPDGGVTNDGETTRVDLPGLHISARNDNASVRVGGIRINANDDESTIHIVRDVRMRGEALSRNKRGIRATFISTNKADPNGYRFVGYEAAGPKTGPLTVAIVKAKSEISHDGDVARDVQRLVRRNGGA